MAETSMTLDMACAEAEAKVMILAEEIVGLGLDLDDDKVASFAIDFLWDHLSPEAHALFRAEVAQGRSDTLISRMVETLRRGGKA